MNTRGLDIRAIIVQNEFTKKARIRQGSHHRDRVVCSETRAIDFREIVGDPAHFIDTHGESSGEIALFRRARVLGVLGTALLVGGALLCLALAANQGVEVALDAFTQAAEKVGFVDHLL